jgi:serine/threonine-protein kinase RsbW
LVSALSSTGSHGRPDERADVALRTPADEAYVAVLRSTAAGLAARLDFTIDDIEDLRMAVGEACALVLPAADVGGDLSATFHLGANRMRVEVAVDAATPLAPDTDSFAWQVLNTLAEDVTCRAHPGSVAIGLSIRSDLDDPPPSSVGE